MRNLELPIVAIITPTYNRDIKVIDRCVRSVGSQSYIGGIVHIICSDGPEEKHVKAYVVLIV